MRASGNGGASVCAHNLLRIVRGEVPYERVKGLDPRLIDSPLSVSAEDLEADAQWLVETYEPRVTLESVTVKPNGAAGGDFSIIADIKETEV